jgi:hypothetical protein
MANQQNSMFLQMLGLSQSMTDVEVELARLEICKVFGLPSDVSDEVIIAIAGKLKHKSATKPTESRPQFAQVTTSANHDELAQIPRTTLTGLTSTMNTRSSHNKLSPWHKGDNR